MSGTDAYVCPVCRTDAARFFMNVDCLDYYRCDCCEARFLDPLKRLDRSAEKAQYDFHENDNGDAGYRRFLSKLAVPLLEKLPAGASGLDYGCGPGPALGAMLREAGHHVALYDPFYFPDESLLERQYDFISCSEVAEHFHDPASEFDRFDAMLKPGGWLGVMTCFQTDDVKFANWHYRKDPTHVVFYREATMRKLAADRGWRCEIPVKDVALMQRTPVSSP